MKVNHPRPGMQQLRRAKDALTHVTDQQNEKLAKIRDLRAKKKAFINKLLAEDEDLKYQENNLTMADTPITSSEGTSKSVSFATSTEDFTSWPQ